MQTNQGWQSKKRKGIFPLPYFLCQLKISTIDGSKKEEYHGAFINTITLFGCEANYTALHYEL